MRSWLNEIMPRRQLLIRHFWCLKILKPNPNYRSTSFIALAGSSLSLKIKIKTKTKINYCCFHIFLDSYVFVPVMATCFPLLSSLPFVLSLSIVPGHPTDAFRFSIPTQTQHMHRVQCTIFQYRKLPPNTKSKKYVNKY